MTTNFPRASERLEFEIATAAHFADLLEVYNSNSFFMKLNFGKEQVTIAEVENDHQENEAYACSYAMVMCERGTKKVVGLAHWLLNNPRDGYPWLGLIMLHKEKQGFGYAKEFLDVLRGWYVENGYRHLRLAILQDNAQILPFYEKYGFRIYDTKEIERYGTVICLSIPLLEEMDKLPPVRYNSTRMW